MIVENKKITAQLLFLFVFLFCASRLSIAQQSKAVVSGTILNQQDEALYQAYVHLEDTGIYTKTDETGYFSLEATSGTYRLTVSRIGYESKTVEVQLTPNEEAELSLRLNRDPNSTLADVIVYGKSAAQKINESAYNVSTIDASALKNTTMDVSQVLDNVSGIKIRKSGGMGSETRISLNGYSGRHIKLFLDGIPMKGYGSTLQINNIPVNMADRIEVYKGVVPIKLGSDALGGAINIVTNNRSNTYLDASYSFGSFNTHKSYINGSYTSKTGFTASLYAYQNYSDNNYKVNAKILDLETNLFRKERQKVRRFNDGYHNETLIAKAGLVDKSFADKLLLGVTLGNKYDEIQNPMNMSFVYGERIQKAKTLTPSLVYKKNDLLLSGLNLSVNAYRNFGRGARIDTASRRYNWLGEYIERDNRGELSYTDYHFKNRNSAVNANVTYILSDRHAITINNSFISFSRRGHDNADPSPADGHPQRNYKDILGLNYKFSYNDRWNTSLFLKYYTHTVRSYVDPDGGNDFDNYSITRTNTGYGLASTYFIASDLQVKASYEKTYRLPTGRELFGSNDGIELGNIELLPESSNNINIGFGYNPIINGKHSLNISANFLYRRTEDYIRRQVRTSTGTTGATNEGLVVNKGIDTELRYSYKSLFTLGGTFTYQDIRNKLKYHNNSTVVSTTYNDRVPNVPYLYGNFDLNFFFHNILREGDDLKLGYNIDYIHEFYYG